MTARVFEYIHCYEFNKLKCFEDRGTIPKALLSENTPYDEKQI